ncbi:MAG: hypothetical protein ACUZ77_01335 [Candidatus Brocadiales bacterium]
MDKRNVFLIILVFVLIAAGIYNFYHFSSRRKAQSAFEVYKLRLAATKRKTNRNSKKPITKVSLKASPQNLLLTLPEGWGRNPFLTPAEIKQIQASKNSFLERESKPVRPLPQYVVTSVIISGAQKVAVIGGKIVSLGDSIGREVVKGITTEGVELAMEGNLRTVKLRQGRTEIKTRVR